jgi:hypothetical protein
MSTPFRPVVYVKRECPFCMKLMIFLREAGYWDKVELRTFVTGDDAEAGIRAELEPHIEKLSFPVAQVAPGDYRTESDALIDYFADASGFDRKDAVLLDYYLGGMFPKYIDMFKRLMAAEQAAA